MEKESSTIREVIMEYFGWLAKGKCAISLLDIIIMLFEFVIVASLVILVINVRDYFKAK